MSSKDSSLKRSYLESFKWIYKYLSKQQKSHFWMLFFGIIIVTLLETIHLGIIALFASAITNPEALGSSRYVSFLDRVVGVDRFVSENNIVVVLGSIMLILTGIKNFAKGVVAYSVARFGGNLEAFFGTRLLRGFLELPYQWHLSQNTADLVHAVHWRTFLGTSFVKPSLTLFNNVLLVLMMLTAVFLAQPFVALIQIVVLGSTAFLIFRGVKVRLDKYALEARDNFMSMNQEATKAIHGIKDVKITRKVEAFVSRFKKRAVPQAKIIGRQQFYTDAPVLVMETVGIAMLFSTILIMSLYFRDSRSQITIVMTLLAVSAWKVMPAINKILSSITQVRKSLPYLDLQIDYLELTEDFININVKYKQKYNNYKFEDRITLENVSFHYIDDRPIVANVSFDIKKGETIGIIGNSGSGKSTLVNLVTGLLEPTDGQIIVDGQALTQAFLPRWLKEVGYVSQSPYIFDGTLAENVAFGLDVTNIERKKIEKCCSMAAMDDFVHDLPDGIDSSIGERGAKLSGGQQQRVTIARALYHSPSILIFDEATSSLDVKSEQSIVETIYSFKGKQTLIIVAHRLTTVSRCDRVLWMEHGTIKMIDTPDKVLPCYERREDSKPIAQE